MSAVEVEIIKQITCSNLATPALGHNCGGGLQSLKLTLVH